MFTEGDLHHPGVRWGNVGSESGAAMALALQTGILPFTTIQEPQKLFLERCWPRAACLLRCSPWRAKEPLSRPGRRAAGGRAAATAPGLCPLTLILAGFLLAFPCLRGRPARLPAAA